jgi:hypothetical protein
MRPSKSFSRQKDFDVSNRRILAFWQGLYSDDLPGLVFPERHPGIDHLLVIGKGFSRNKIFHVCGEKFPVYSFWEDLDESIYSVGRTSDKAPYAIYVRDSTEPDEESENLSAVELGDKGVRGINLLERLIFEWEHFTKTGEHLDIENTTLCSGSISLDEKIPAVRWTPKGLRILWYGPHNKYPYLGTREVIAPSHLI